LITFHSDKVPTDLVRDTF